jgi:hypothetical protein
MFSSSIFCLLLAATNAFAPAALHNSVHRSSSLSPSSSAVFLSANNENVVDRRDAFVQATRFVAGIALTSGVIAVPKAANAAEGTTSKVVVAGATGQTGRRILERLAQAGNLEVIGGVRNVEKATASLGETSTVVRGAMVQTVASVDTSAVNLKHLDVVKDSIDELAASMEGATSLVIATGFIPGNPLKMNAAAHEVVSRVESVSMLSYILELGSILSSQSLSSPRTRTHTVFVIFWICTHHFVFRTG